MVRSVCPLTGDELPCDMRIPSDKQDKLHGCLEHLFNQVGAPLRAQGSRESRGVGGSALHLGEQPDPCPCTQVDAIHALLKGPVMSRAFEETKHFPMEHSLQGERQVPAAGGHAGEGGTPATLPARPSLPTAVGPRARCSHVGIGPDTSWEGSFLLLFICFGGRVQATEGGTQGSRRIRLGAVVCGAGQGTGHLWAGAVSLVFTVRGR